jgi:hypothetical protein
MIKRPLESKIITRNGDKLFFQAFFYNFKSESGCQIHKKLHKYKIRKLSFQSSSTKSGSRTASINNQINWVLPFPFKPNTSNKQIFTIETNTQELPQEIPEMQK